MMKLLNRNHGPIVRGLAAVVAYCATLLATQRRTLAAESARCFATKNDFKLGARRGAWYYRRSWIGLDVAQDDFFDPTDGMTDPELDALASFLSARKPHVDPLAYTADQAFIAARRLVNNNDPHLHAAKTADFKAVCDTLLTYEGPAKTAQQTAPKPRQGDFPIADAKQALHDFATLFPPAQMPWFLVSGTFLGLIRENGFLAHDYDIDVGVFDDQIDIAATCAAILASDTFVLKKYDYQPANAFTAQDIPYILKIIHRSGVHIDVFIHYRDTSHTPAIYWHGSSLHRWENSAFELAPYQFYTQEVFGPADADRYLTENYGDWRTPVTDFNCTTDTPNLALVQHPVAVAIFIKRFALSKTADPVDAQRLETELRSNGFVVDGANGTVQLSNSLYANADLGHAL